jgi:RNA polymerase sigma factor (sigma-70 family)
MGFYGYGSNKRGHMSRDIEQFSWFFRGEFEGVVNTAQLVLGDRQEAQDIAQEAFLRLLKHWRKVSRYEHPEAWVRKVAFRLALTAKRKRRVHGLLQSDPPAPSDGWNFADPELARGIATLSLMQRAALVLFYFEDRPMSEIAQILDCSISTAKVHVHKARKKLAELINAEAFNVS